MAGASPSYLHISHDSNIAAGAFGPCQASKTDLSLDLCMETKFSGCEIHQNTKLQKQDLLLAMQTIGLTLPSKLGTKTLHEPTT